LRPDFEPLRIAYAGTPKSEVAPEEKYISTGIPSFDKLIPPGLAVGHLYLLGADPGAGKTSLLLKIADNLCQKEVSVLFYSGEMSLTGLRKMQENYGLTCPGMVIMQEGDIHQISERIRSEKFQVVVIDSFQTIHDTRVHRPSHDEQAMISLSLRDLSKKHGTIFLIIMQVNRDDKIQGSRAVEHNADTVFYMRPGVSDEVIVAAPKKNRQSMGAASRAVFRKTPGGLVEKSEIETGHLPRHTNPFEIGLAGCPVLIRGDFTVDEFTAVKTSASAAGSFTLHGAPNTVSKFLSGMVSGLYPEVSFGFAIRGNIVEKFDRSSDLAVVMALLSAFYLVPLAVDVGFIGALDSRGRLLSVPDMRLRTERALAQGYSMVLGPRRIGSEQPAWTECDDLKAVIEVLGLKLKK